MSKISERFRVKKVEKAFDKAFSQYMEELYERTADIIMKSEDDSLIDSNLATGISNKWLEEIKSNREIVVDGIKIRIEDIINVLCKSVENTLQDHLGRAYQELKRKLNICKEESLLNEDVIKIMDNKITEEAKPNKTKGIRI